MKTEKERQYESLNRFARRRLQRCVNPPEPEPQLPLTAEVVVDKARKLLVEHRRGKELLRWVVSHYKVNTRWPCPECDREGPNAPMRVNRIITESGNEYRLGCSICNGDVLLTEIELFLEG